MAATWHKGAYSRKPDRRAPEAELSLPLKSWSLRSVGRLVLVALLLALPVPPLRAAEEDAASRVSGLPLPRFVSLGSDKVNARTGPGARYPISWVYLRRGLPVEVVAEFEFYRKIRDMAGDEGWVHKRLLSGLRTAVIVGAVRTLHREPNQTSTPVLLAEPGVQGRLLHCQGAWCELEIAGQRGYTRRDYLYGVYPTETVN